MEYSHGQAIGKLQHRSGVSSVHVTLFYKTNLWTFCKVLCDLSFFWEGENRKIKKAAPEQVRTFMCRNKHQPYAGESWQSVTVFVWLKRNNTTTLSIHPGCFSFSFKKKILITVDLNIILVSGV